MGILFYIEQISCTACHYCTGGCPKKIQIPDLFSTMNRNLVFEDFDCAKRDMQMLRSNRMPKQANV
jgi:predicted aldo/keto reductase-like oxidoreductase